MRIFNTVLLYCSAYVTGSFVKLPRDGKMHCQLEAARGLVCHHAEAKPPAKQAVFHIYFPLPHCLISFYLCTSVILAQRHGRESSKSEGISIASEVQPR